MFRSAPSRRVLVIGGLAPVVAAVALWFALTVPGVEDSWNGEPAPILGPARGPAASPAAPAPGRTTAGLGAAGFYHAGVGTTLTYRIDAAFTTDLSAADGPGVTQQAGTLRLGLLGPMVVAIQARREDEICARFAFPGIRLSRGGAQDAAGAAWSASITRALADGAVVRMRADGQTLGLRFPPETNADGRNWLRALIAAVRFVVPADAQSEWEVEEEGSSGRMLVRYRRADPRLAGAIARTSSELLAGPGAERSVRKPVFTGGGRAEFDADTGWPSTLHLDEELAFEVQEASTTVRHGTRGTWRLDRVATESGAADAEVWEGAWVSVDGSAEASEYATAAARDARRRLVGGLRLEDIVAALDRLATGEDRAGLYEQRRLLVALLLEKPETAARVRDLLLAGVVADAARIVLLGALAKAGSPETQRELGAILADGAADHRLRQFALDATFQVADPVAVLAGCVVDCLTQSRPQDELAGSSLLALGALARRGRAGDAATKAQAVLAAWEVTAQREGRTVVWLEALGNAGGAFALVRAAPYLESPEPDIRTAAVDALRNTDQSAAAERVQRALRDPVGSVRACAVDVLAGWRGTQFLAPLMAAAASDPDAQVRRTALIAVARHRAESPAASDLLGRIAAADIDPDLRRLASELRDRR